MNGPLIVIRNKGLLVLTLNASVEDYEWHEWPPRGRKEKGVHEEWGEGGCVTYGWTARGGCV